MLVYGNFLIRKSLIGKPHKPVAVTQYLLTTLSTYAAALGKYLKPCLSPA